LGGREWAIQVYAGRELAINKIVDLGTREPVEGWIVSDSKVIRIDIDKSSL
jgi:hypothetical protein